jgi:DNA-binding NtrC family response regulator
MNPHLNRNEPDGWPHWSILVVDDEEGMRNFMLKILAPRCHWVSSANSAEEAALLAQQQRIDLLILDITLPGKSGVEWLKELRQQGYSGEVILITAFADLETAIESLRAGASDFILKPFRIPQILNAIKKCYERASLRRENFVLRRDAHPTLTQGARLIGASTGMANIRESIERMAPTPSTVLIGGESGTGKELVARELHALSTRAQGPFVVVNCASLSADDMATELFGHMEGGAQGLQHARDGLFYYAQGGTLFLDEVAELPMSVQAGLLRALEEKQIRPVGSNQTLDIDVRIVAATNRDLAQAVAQGRFRQDLYYRLQVLELMMPPLRERTTDIEALVEHFIEHLSQRLGRPPIQLTVDEWVFLKQYHWPGNVRELRNLIERSLILGQLNVSALYPMAARSPRPQGHSGPTDLETMERQHILSVLDSVGGDKTRAAALLGVSRRTLERRVADWAQHSLSPHKTT